ncbi:tail fiber protein [Paenibacillus barcinonensis]|uniref:tail fiber protein n=1 Tax=Paenibacillus barcinonensis TaxID=198119 RepID=UPI001C103D7B|nr:tail fiber protein [Paenibacillus barcinonensis]MBU5353614.1 tail fiber protein [Paenibacillus barcinonensis]
MPKETDRLKLPLPLGNENVTRESINAIFEKIDAGVATREAILISAGSDLNSYITEGEYYCPENATVETLANSPTGVAFHLTIERHAGVVQTLTTFEPSDLQVFQRNYYFGWGSWKKVPTRDEIQQLQEDLQNADIPPASLTEPGIVQLSNATEGNSETLAATEKAVSGVFNDLSEHKNDISKHISISERSQWNNATGYGTTIGSANSYIINLSPAPLAIVPGMRVALKVHVNNNGASTLNINGLGAKPIKKANGSDLTIGNFKEGGVYTVIYDGEVFILQGEGGEYGTANEGDVRAGKTIITENGLVSGTLLYRGNPTFKSDLNNAVSIPAGIYNQSSILPFEATPGNTRIYGPNSSESVSGNVTTPTPTSLYVNIKRSGVYRTELQFGTMWSTVGVTVYVQIYSSNGSTGTLRSMEVRGNTSPLYVEDLYFYAGSRVGVRLWFSSSSGVTMSVSNFSILVQLPNYI